MSAVIIQTWSAIHAEVSGAGAALAAMRDVEKVKDLEAACDN